MMIIKCIFLIALLQYSCGKTLENRMICSLRKTNNVLTIFQTTTSKPKISCGVNKECTNFQHCDNGKLNTDGDLIIDLRDDINNVCSHYSDVCCESANISDKPIEFIEHHKTATKCGVMNPNGVGLRIKEIIDREAQFGKVS